MTVTLDLRGRQAPDPPSLSDQLTRMKTERDRAINAFADMRTERNALKDYMREMQEAVVVVDGKARTLWELYESGDFRPLCTVCWDAECGSEHEVLNA